MEVYQLRYFAAIARAGSMVAAAAECHVAQPTLSVQIKALEEEIGVPLLERHSWGIRLTRAGERVLSTANRVFEDLDQLRQDIKGRRFGRLPTLRLGIQPYLASEVFAEPLRALKTSMPDLRVVMRERPNDSLLDLLFSGQIDLCLMSKLPVWPKELVCSELLKLQYSAYFRTDHPLAAKRILRLRDLLPFPLLIFNGPPNPEPRMQQLAQQEDVELHVAFSTDLASTAFAMAATGAGVAILPSVFDEHCAHSRMQRTLLQDAAFTATICAVWPKRAEAPSGAELLLDLIRRHGVNTS